MIISSTSGEEQFEFETNAMSSKFTFFESETSDSIVYDLGSSDFPADLNQNDSECEDIASINDLTINNLSRKVVGVELPLPITNFAARLSIGS